MGPTVPLPLFRTHLIEGCIDSQECEGGHQIEDVQHFVLHCPIFKDPRMIILNNVNAITKSFSVMHQNLLYGNKK